MACSGNVSAAGSRGCSGVGAECSAYAANTFDSLLEELQTTGKVEVGGSGHNGVTGSASGGNTATLRRLHSFPADAKPPVPERLGDLAAKRVPPPPPPRTSSKSPLASPTNPMAPAPRRSPTRKGSLGSASNGLAVHLHSSLMVAENERQQPSPSTSSSCESINSQEGLQHRPAQMPHLRQEQLEIRHQELLKKQRALQEQYSRLQQLQQTPPPDLLQLKKTGSEGNIFSKMGMTFAPAISGSTSVVDSLATSRDVPNAEAKTKVYETDIL
ncbi:hypothetical protein V9T40_011992 [Parthenolecanium corni]|uniref:Uncharacterized protein n=1 Tax=Parthenolecanium corni TaxID=536013 RepID=A0AAN9TMB3_9HEMI